MVTALTDKYLGKLRHARNYSSQKTKTSLSMLCKQDAVVWCVGGGLALRLFTGTKLFGLCLICLWLQKLKISKIPIV